VGVTLLLLWEEYRAAIPTATSYSWFCERYEAWRALDVVMRQDHRAGEKLFVDYAGQTVEVVDRASGEIREAQIFVAVLGASNYTYAEATWTQGCPTGSARTCGPSPTSAGCRRLVPDNLRSGVSKAHRYEPDLNPTYQELANHYGVAVVPARVRKPRDKAKAEVGVQIVERWILAGLRHRPSSRWPSSTGHRRAARTAQHAALQEAARLAPQPVRARSIARRCARCRPEPLRLRHLEEGAGATSTTTSRSTGTTTRCPITW
jgi:transposase